MKKLCLVILFLYVNISFAQLKGTIFDNQGKPISYATIIVEQSQQGVISNEKGQYELNLKANTDYTISYQFLGYKTERLKIHYQSEPLIRDVVLQTEEFQLDDIVINVGGRSADDIMRKAIQNKSSNTAGMSSFTVDFYSKGMVKTLKIPKVFQNKISLNDQKMVGIDSVGRGILYLSETMSELKYHKPNKLKEHIIASKVSGSSNGYSFNTADESFYDFYENYLLFDGVGTGAKLISPLANSAFSYYNYILEATFKDQGASIHKIKVMPKSKAQPTFSGDLYIVEGSGAIYGVDLTVTGVSLQEPFIERITINQNYAYNAANTSWVKRSQNLDLTFGALGMQVQGIFLSVFSNYNFEPNFTRATFDKEILSFAKDVTKKDDDYWAKNRLFALTEEEAKDYQFKDSIRAIRESPAYKDSLRTLYNTFSFMSPLEGYNYHSKNERFKFNYNGILNLESIGFNTVQGFWLGTGFDATFYGKDKKKFTQASVDFNYGFASDRFRSYGKLMHYFNDTHKSRLYVEGGSKIEQFYSPNIDEYMNTIFSLLMRYNYAKYYNNDEVYIGYSGKFMEEAISLKSKIGYEQRSPLFNKANGSFYTGHRAYTANNPLDPTSMTTSAIDQHHIYKFNAQVDFSFGMSYITMPERRVYVKNRKYPDLSLFYEKGFGASEKHYNYDQLEAKLSQTIPFSNKGQLDYNLKAGHFFGGDGISFVDRKHFAGNLTHININDTRLTSFNLLPYYSLSSNKSYAEMHFEYDFQGFLVNKVPLLRATGWNLVLGYHNAITSSYKPYQEFTAGFSNIGLGKLNIFRVDYVRSFNGASFNSHGVMVGMSKRF